jgi:hypothetical protein
LDAVRYSKDELREYFDRIDVYLTRKAGGATTVNYTLEVLHLGHPLYIIEYPKLPIMTEARENDVAEVFDKSGIYELQAEFLPSETHLIVEYPHLRTNNPETKIPVTGRAKTAGYSCFKDFGTYYIEGVGENIWQSWRYDSVTYYNGIPSYDWLTEEEIAQQAVDGWIGSPGHRENILTDTYDRSGIGVALGSDDKVLITQDFC